MKITAVYIESNTKALNIVCRHHEVSIGLNN
jgi:hypothetical protein